MSEPRDDTVRVRGLTDEGFLCRIESGAHRLQADEPWTSGGKDQGPDPYDYLAISLGTCTVMTLNLYARHKKLPVEAVSCRVRHRKTHAEDCAECESQERSVDELERSISIEGALSDEQRQRMLEIAERCPVHRSLAGRIRVRSQLVPA